MPKKREYESGQAVLIFLLFMAVVLTIALSFIARSTTDVNISSRSEQSLRAFSAAEAGVENALITGVSETGSVVNSNDPSTVYTTTTNSLATKDFNYPEELSSGDSATIWLVNHDGNGDIFCDAGTYNCFKGNSLITPGSLKVCWGADGTPSNSTTTPAIEVSMFYSTDPTSIRKVTGGSVNYDYSSVKVARVAVDPNTSRSGPVGFPTTSFSAPDSGTCTINGIKHQFQKTFSINQISPPGSPPDFLIPNYLVDYGMLFARIRVLYNSGAGSLPSPIGGHVEPVALPKQGIEITSVGVSGDTTRKLHVFQNLGEPPAILDSTLFSPNSITK